MLELPASGGWTLNQAPVDSAAIVGQLQAIYGPRPANARLLLVRVPPEPRQQEDLGWLLAQLDRLEVVVVQVAKHRTWTGSAGITMHEVVPEVHSARVAGALDSLGRGSISAEAAARTIADERIATCSLIEEDTARALYSAVQTELERRAGWR